MVLAGMARIPNLKEQIEANKEKKILVNNDFSAGGVVEDGAAEGAHAQPPPCELLHHRVAQERGAVAHVKDRLRAGEEHAQRPGEGGSARRINGR